MKGQDMNTDFGKVSIIIPIYNVKQYVAKCIESVFNQTYNNLEIILVDDGSTDGSANVIEKYEYDKRIRIFHKTNGGLSDARNYGLDKVTGKYVFFLDSDDYIEPTTIEICLGVIVAKNADIVECHVNHVSNEKSYIHARPDVGEYNKIEALKGILDYRFRIVAWNKLYRAFLWESIRFPKGKINEDEHTIPYVIEKCNKYIAIRDALYNYVQREGSIMNSDFDEKNMSIVEAYKNRLSYFSEKYNHQFDGFIVYRYSLVLSKIYSEAKNTNYRAGLGKERNKILIRVLKDRRISYIKKIKVIGFYFFPKVAYKTMKRAKFR